MPEIRIDGLPAAAKAELNHVVPVMRGGVASKLTLAQIIDILAGSTSPFSLGAAAAARTNLGIDAAPYMPIPVTADTTTDWNTITALGWHSKLLYGPAPNGMGAAGYFYLFIAGYSTVRTQFAFPYRLDSGFISGSGSIWARRFYEGVWAPWAELSLPRGRLDVLYAAIGHTHTAAAVGAIAANDTTVVRTTGNQTITGAKSFTGTMQAASLEVAGSPVAAFYAGSDAGATDLPLGHAVHIVISTNTTDRNATQAVYLAGGNTTNYSNTSGGAQLSGTWRSRGAGSGAMLAQRVA